MEDRLTIPSVTGTDLELEIAGPGGRSYAFVIDWHIRLLLALAWYIAVGLLYAGTISWLDIPLGLESGFLFIVGLPATVIYFFYHPVLEILLRGRTPGKRIAGIRVVTLQGQEPGVGAHLIRNVFRLVDSLPFAYVIGFTTSLVTDRHVRFGDLAAGTVLVYDAADEEKALEQVVAAQQSDIGFRESELVHEMLQRWNALDADTRRDLGLKLLARLGVDAAHASEAEIFAKLKTCVR